MSRYFKPVPALKPGAHVRVIAPSSPFDKGAFNRGLTFLRQRYQVSFDREIFASDGFLAGDDARRLNELHSALDDPSVDGIMAARGGYGATRLLSDVCLEKVRSAEKLLIGFSDITALHCLWSKAGLRSVHGNMVTSIGRKRDPRLETRWLEHVEGHPPSPIRNLEVWTPGDAIGPLVGGNLSVLAALCGTPHAPSARDCILFLEDVGEAAYRIDRMLTTLHQSDFFNGVAGIILGTFVDCTPGRYGRGVIETLKQNLKNLKIPIYYGIPSGHQPDNLELPMGAPVVLRSSENSVHFDAGATC